MATNAHSIQTRAVSIALILLCVGTLPWGTKEVFRWIRSLRDMWSHFDQDFDCLVIGGQEQVKAFLQFLKAETMGDKRLKMDIAGFQNAESVLEIPIVPLRAGKTDFLLNE